MRYYITDRRSLGGVEALLRNIECQIRAGVDWIQIREKDLATRELLSVARRATQLAAGSTTGILVNSRMDIAIAGGASGVHLPSNSPPAVECKRCAGGLRVGVSVHNRAELLRAESEGADYVLLGPVFAPLSKSAHGPPLGLDRFHDLAQAVRIPVIALGGITAANMADCERAGAAGAAGISLFQIEE